MELESLRLDFLFTIFFLRLFVCLFFFFFHLPSHSLLPSPLKPKIVLPSSSKSISQNPNPLLKIPNPNHDLNLNQSKNWVRGCEVLEGRLEFHVDLFIHLRSASTQKSSLLNSICYSEIKTQVASFLNSLKMLLTNKIVWLL